MPNNYVYVATVNGRPVAARRRKYNLLHDIEGFMRHASDNVRVLRANDSDYRSSALVDITEQVMRDGR